MSPRVLVGFADALAAIESAWNLTEAGFEVHAFSRRGTRPALARSAGIGVTSITAPERDAFSAADDLAAAVRDISPAVILPLDDQAVWLADQLTQRLALESDADSIAGAAIAGPIGPDASLALDKRVQLIAAEAAGFAVPPSLDPSVELPAGAGPWIVKPALAIELRGSSLHRSTARIASDFAQIRDAVTTIGGPVTLQPFLAGTGEGIFGLATRDGVTALSAHRRIRMMNPRGSGSSACRSIPVPPELVGPVREFLRAADWRGLFMIELLRDDAGQAWFMELNGRAWGSMALACRRGYAYPAWAVQQALDGRFAPAVPTDAPHLTARHLGREVVHLGAVMARGGAPRLATAREVLRLRHGERWYNWRADQIDVFAADSWATIRSQLTGRRRTT
jgi:hypothetical protein